MIKHVATIEDEPGHTFHITDDGGVITVASVNERVGDWAAYRGQRGDWKVVRRVGDKISQREAEELFPECASYRYRC